MVACISQLTTAVLQALLAQPTLIMNTNSFVPQTNNFSGNGADCKEFLLQCSLYFATQTRTTDWHVAQFINMLKGKGIKWATMVWEKGNKPTASYECFGKLFHRVFNHSSEGVEISNKLLTIKERKRWVGEYALEFHSLAAGSGWNEPALKAAFQQGLDPHVLTVLGCWDKQADQFRISSESGWPV